MPHAPRGNGSILHHQLHSSLTCLVRVRAPPPLSWCWSPAPCTGRTLPWQLRYVHLFFPKERSLFSTLLDSSHPDWYSNTFFFLKNSLNMTSAWLPQNRLLPILCSLLPGFCSDLYLFLSTLNHNFLFTCLLYSILSTLRIEVMSDLCISPVSDVVLGTWNCWIEVC